MIKYYAGDNKMRRKLDLTGQRYGKLIVVKEVESIRVGKKKVPKRRWLCICDCGEKTIVQTDSLRSGQTKSCGCIKPINVSKANLIDLTGQKFGYLTVVKKVEKESNLPTTFWLCKCDCGKETIVTASNLKSGHTKSCGCLKRNGKGVYLTKNGRYRAVLYHNRKLFHVGVFDTEEEAITAKEEMRKRLE